MSTELTNVEKKTTLAFSFSKVKAKTSLSVKSTETVKAFEITNKKFDEDSDKRELIGAIEGKKVKSISNPEANVKQKPLVIPCKKNQINFNPKLIANANQDDLEVIKELIKDTQKEKNEKEKDQNLTVEMKETKEKELESIEDPNYEQIGIEQFGLAALRGMGWNEKIGIGLSNKRSIKAVEPELRPKGLGLGAGMSSKKHRSDKETEKQNDENSSLRYSKGAHIQVTAGKNCDEYGQIVGFDDGLDRMIVKLASSDNTVSLLQSCTRLVSKSEYKKETERLR